VKVSPVLAVSPDKARFLCLNHIPSDRTLPSLDGETVDQSHPKTAGHGRNVYPTDDKVASLKSAAEY